jgi:ABC-type transport system substrate-binding protein
LRDNRVRRAIAHSINIEGFVEEVLLNKANILSIPVLERVRGYPTHLAPYKYHLEYSRLLMTEAGYSNGFDMKIQVIEGKFANSVIDLITESLKDININANFVFVSHLDLQGLILNDLISAFIGGSPFRGRINIHDSLPDYYARFPDNIYINQSIFRLFPEIWNYIEDLQKMSQFDERMDIYQQRLASLVHQEAVVIPLFEPYDIWVIDKRFSFNYSNTFRFIDFKVIK